MSIITRKLIRIFNLAKIKIILSKNGVKCKSNIKNIYGVPIFKLEEKGSLTIGNNIYINSDKISNPIGFTNPMSFWTLGGGKIYIGNNVGMSNASIVAYGANVLIEDNVLLGGGVKIYSSNFHSIAYRDRTERPEINVIHKDVIIKKGAFIGAGSMILKGVTIGRYSIVGAGSVVSKSIPDNQIWIGNPARFIREIKENEEFI